jgi:hypothetical protein
MWKIILCDGIHRNIKILRIMYNYKKAVAYAEELHKLTGKSYKVERV